jgi:hypothetical protein
MNRPEHELAKKLVQYLDYGVDHLEPGVRERLAAARRSALSHYREKPETVLGLAWAGQAAHWLAEHRSHSARLLIAAAALVLATAGVVYWQNAGPANGLTDIDLNLLTDELPINAYLDKGFDSWLKRSSR